MASINGIELRDLKPFKGHEGEDLWQGTVYYNGINLGFWTMDAWGGADSYCFNTSILKEDAESYVASERVPDKYKSFACLDNLIADLIMLMDIEKVYNKYVKEGYQTIVVVTDNINLHCIGYTGDDKEKAAVALSREIENCKKKCFKGYPVSVQYFNSMSDFVINTNVAPHAVKRRAK